MRAVAFFLLIAGISFAQVQNAADVAAGISTSTLAQGSLAVIEFGQNTPTPVTSATVSLLPASSATPVSAQVTSVSGFRITFVVPPDIPTGDADLIYKPGNQATQWVRVSIVPASFALFRGGAPGPPVAQNVNADGTVALNGLATPAQPGQAVVLWGTGLGSTPQSAIEVTLGGVAQPLLYAGAAPGQPGLNQINFQIASGTPDGCYVPLTVTYGTQSVTSFLSKTSDGLPCHHPFGLSVQAMKELDNGGSIQAGEISLATNIQAPSADRASRQESAQVLNPFTNASNLANYFISVAKSPAQPCSILSGGVLGVLGGAFDPATLGTITLQRGTSTLTLPWTEPQTGDSPLNDLPAPGLAAGNWTWRTTGGPLLAASSFDFVLPPPVQLAASVPIAINRSRNQTIAWNGSGFDSTATLRLSLTAQSPSSPVLTCSVPAQTGSVTLPSNLLAQFTPGSAGVLSVTVSETGSGIPHAQFNSPNGNPLLMLVNWSGTDARPVDFQ